MKPMSAAPSRTWASTASEFTTSTVTAAVARLEAVEREPAREQELADRVARGEPDGVAPASGSASTASAAASASSACCAYGSRARPGGLSRTPKRPRSSRFAPTRRSSAASRLVTADCGEVEGLGRAVHAAGLGGGHEGGEVAAAQRLGRCGHASHSIVESVTAQLRWFSGLRAATMTYVSVIADPAVARGTIARAPRIVRPARGGRLRGLAAVGAVVALAFALTGLIPGVSPLLWAMALGLVASPLVRRAGDAEAGVDFAASTLLRTGVALLGLRIALGDLASLGVSGVGLAAGTLAATFAFTVWLGPRIGVPRGATLLVAAGCSICGAAAIAAMSSVTDSEDEDAGRAVAAVGVLGCLAMLLVPFLGIELLGLGEERTALWAGASIHEVAQVTAAGAAISVAALKTATLVKLVRVVLLAPTVAIAGHGARGTATPVPGFVLAFLGLVLVRTVIPLPAEVLDGAAIASLLLLAAGMGALALQIRPRTLVAGGARPLLLAVAATGCALVTGLALVVVLP